MADITWDDVVNHASELGSVDEDAQDDILDYVNRNVATDLFTASQLKLAKIYLAAHLGTVAKSKGSTSTGAVTSETAGRLTRSYSVVASATSDLDGSSYGKQYSAMVKRSAARVPFVP